jgi:hypothetical protein
MPKFLITDTVTAATAGSAYCILRAVTYRCLLRTISIYNPAATLLELQIGRAVLGTTATSPKAGVTLDPNAPPSFAVLEKAWSAGTPTAPSSVMKTVTIAATIGTGGILPFQVDANIYIPAGAGIVCWNSGAATGPAFRVDFECEE